MTVRGGVAALVTGAVLAVGGAAGAAPPDPATPTTLEQALIERACSSPPAVLHDPATHEECLHARLTALRADFGRDLSRLSSAERRKIDAACGQIREIQGREAYLDCLHGQLGVVQYRWNRPRAATAEPAAAAEPAPVQSAIMPSPSATGRSSSSSRIWLLVALTTVLSAGGAASLVIKGRRARRVCKVCGARVENTGELCPSCRHEAAETVRRAAAERTDRQRALDEQERRQRDHDEEERRRIVREADENRLRQQELAARSEADRQLEEEARRSGADADAQQHPAGGAEPEVAFDPYAILGVPPDASADAIHSAYLQAKSKYDLEQVADLGFEITQHYITKLQAVDRAFEMLAPNGPVAAESPAP